MSTTNQNQVMVKRQQMNFTEILAIIIGNHCRYNVENSKRLKLSVLIL